jgi:hypothetical protein
MKKELCLPTDTFVALTRRLENRLNDLAHARERLSSICEEKANHARDKREWERFHHGIATSRDLLARSAQQDVDLAHAMVDIEEALSLISERTSWYDEQSNSLHALYLAASGEHTGISNEIDMLEGILSRAFCEGAVEGMPVED